MNRLPSRTRQGRRDIIAIVLLVVPLVALGYYLAVIEVAVDPPPDPAGGSTPTVVTTPVSASGDVPATPATPSPGDAAATPSPGASGITSPGQGHPIGIMSISVPVPRT